MNNETEFREMIEAFQGAAKKFVELANSAEAHELMVNSPTSFDLDLPLEDKDKSSGFTFVGNDTWFPTPLYEARKRRWHNLARENESAVVWTR